MTDVDWIKAGIDLALTIIGGVIVAVTVYFLDERRVKRERRLSDVRIASNWETSNPKVSLRDFDLRDSNLSGFDFSAGNFERAKFQKAYLRVTIFKDANLIFTDFRSAEIAATDFTNAIVFYSNFSKAVIRSRSDESKKEYPTFTNAHFRGVNFRNAKISDAKFHGTILKDADFSGAIVRNCDFTKSDLTNSKWNKVKRVENCIWKGVKIGDTNTFPNWLLEEIQVQNIKQKKKKQNGR